MKKREQYILFFTFFPIIILGLRILGLIEGIRGSVIEKLFIIFTLIGCVISPFILSKIKNVYAKIGMFLLNYVYFVLILLLTFPMTHTLVHALTYILGIRQQWIAHSSIWGKLAFIYEAFICTLIVFIFLICLGLIRIIKRSGNNFSNFVKLYIPFLFFWFPTITTSCTSSADYTFESIFPFGYSAIFFIKNIFEQVDPIDIFTQIFQHKWLFLHFISLILAIIFIIVFRKYLHKLHKNKTLNIC